MKNSNTKAAVSLRLIAIIALLAVIGFSMAACNSDSPKGLAKQTYDILKQQTEIGFTDLEKYQSLSRQFDVIEQKVEKLSEKDQEIFAAELERLYTKNPF